jgi:hypothetical protein
MVKNIKGKPLITQSYFDYNFRGIASMIRRGVFAIIVLLICVLIMLGLTYDAVGAVPEATHEVDVTAQLCPPSHDPEYGFTDVITATINLGSLTPSLHLYDIEVWDGESLFLSFPADSGLTNVTGGDPPKDFVLVKRSTGERWLLIRPRPFVRIPCQTITPPTPVTAVWIELREWVASNSARRVLR